MEILKAKITSGASHPPTPIATPIPVVPAHSRFAALACGGGVEKKILKKEKKKKNHKNILNKITKGKCHKWSIYFYLMCNVISELSIDSIWSLNY